MMQAGVAARINDSNRLNSILPFLMLHLLLICDDLIASRFYELLGSSFRTLLFGCALLVVLLFAVLCLMRGWSFEFYLAICMVSFIFLQHLVFSSYAGTNLNINT